MYRALSGARLGLGDEREEPGADPDNAEVDQVGSHGTMTYPLAGLVQIGGDPRQPIGSPRGQAEGDDLGLQIAPVRLDHGTIPPQGRYRVRQV